MKFKEWLELQETGTSTGDIAGFSRISIPLVRRVWPPSVATMFAEKPPKKKIKMQPQVKESANPIIGRIGAIAQQIAAGTAPPETVRRYLNELIAVLQNPAGEGPNYLNMVATIQQNILPAIARDPSYRREHDLLQALAS